jgi:hypothetical protein
MMPGNTADSVADADGCQSAGKPLFTAGPPAARNTHRMFFLLAWCCALAANPGRADQRDDWGPVPTIVVVRLSQALLDPLVSADIHDRSEVNQVVLGRLARGHAETNGHVRLDLQEGDSFSPARFMVVFQGVTVARTRTRSGPAIVDAVATTQFTATKRIALNSDRSLEDSTAQISARTSTRAVSIQSTLRGPGGCLVRRVAARRFQRDLPIINAEARRNAQSRIAASFDQQIKERLGRLNEQVAKLKLRAVGIREASEPKVLLSTTENFFEISIPGSVEPLSPPVLPDAGLDTCLAQVWIHWSVLQPADRLRSPDLAVVFEQLDQLRKKYAVVRLAFDLDGIPALAAIADPWAVIGIGDQRLFQESGD